VGVPIAAIELGHFERDGDLDAELERLVEGAAGERHTRNPGGKAKIILDARRSTGLAAERLLVERDRRQAFGSRIHCGRKSRGPGTNHGNVVDLIRVEVRRDPEADAGLGIGGPLQHSAVGAEHDWQLLWQNAEALHDRATLFAVGNQHGVRVAVSAEEIFQAIEV